MRNNFSKPQKYERIDGQVLLGGHLGCFIGLGMDECTSERWVVDSKELKLHPAICGQARLIVCPLRVLLALTLQKRSHTTSVNTCLGLR